MGTGQRWCASCVHCAVEAACSARGICSGWRPVGRRGCSLPRWPDVRPELDGSAERPFTRTFRLADCAHTDTALQDGSALDAGGLASGVRSLKSGVWRKAGCGRWPVRGGRESATMARARCSGWTDSPETCASSSPAAAHRCSGTRFRRSAAAAAAAATDRQQTVHRLQLAA